MAGQRLHAMKKPPSVFGITAAVLVTIGLVTLFLLSADIWLGGIHTARVLRSVHDLHRELLAVQESIINRITNNSNPLIFYSSYFKTQDEIDRLRELEKQFRMPIHSYALGRCNLGCVQNNSKLSSHLSVAENMISLEDRPVHHACCTSMSHYITPTQANNTRGEIVVLVQTQTAKQFFRTENCTQQDGCSGCTCLQPEPFIYDAIVYTSDTFKFSLSNITADHILVAGCCKCVNTVIPPD